jgi:hypothetical protein
LQAGENPQKAGFSASNYKAFALLTARLSNSAFVPAKNMGRMFTKEQFKLLLQRNRIENVWSVMKLNYNLIYHRARSALRECSDISFTAFLPFCFILLKTLRSGSYRLVHLLQNSNFDRL